MKRSPTDVERVHVYLSYAAVEANFTLQLASDLLCEGVPVWMDRLHASAERWESDQQAALNQTAVFIAVVTPEYVQSPYTLPELRAVAKRKIPIIPVLCVPVERSQWLSELQPAALIDFSQWNDKRVYRQRLDELLDDLRPKVDLRTTLDVEARYLHTLVARLEARKPLTQFVDLSANPRPQEQATRPYLRLSELWGKNVPLFEVDADSRRTTPIDSVTAALEKYPQFILTGVSGSGKTTLLERFALDAARKRLSVGREAPLPVYIDLARWTDDETIEAFVQRSATFDGEALIKLTPWEVILCLDHLDELGDNAAERATQIKTWLASDAAPRQVIIACRQAEAVLMQDLPQIAIGDLEEDHIRRYVNACLEPNHAQALLNQFFPSLPDDQPRAVLLCSLARTTAMLAGLVFLYKSSPQSELPQNPGALLKRYFANFWIWKRHSGMPGWMPYKELEGSLHRIARNLLTGKHASQFSYADAREMIGDERFLTAAITSGLIEPIGDQLRFRDRLTLEYFGAVNLSLSDLVLRLMSARFDDWGLRLAQRWDGVVILMSGYLPTPESLIRSVAEIDPYLAARCIASGVRVPETLFDQIVATLEELAFEPQNRGRVEAATILRVFTHRAGMNALLEMMRVGTWRERQSATQIIRQGEMVFPPLLFEDLSTWDWKPSERIAGSLITIGVEGIPLLLNVLSDDPEPQNRCGAAWALGVIDDCAALPALVHALADPDLAVRLQAIAAIGRLRDTAAIPFLTTLLKDEQWDLREAAADALDKIGAPKVGNLKLKEALPERSAKGESLLDLLNSDDWKARVSAIGSLAQFDDPSIIPALLETLHDEDARVRLAVVHVLEQHPDDVVLQALADAVNDEDAAVAEAAQEALGRFKSATPGEPVGVEEFEAEERIEAEADPLEFEAEAAPIEFEAQSLFDAETVAADEVLPFDEQQIAQWEALRDLLESLFASDWHARREAATALREQAKSLRGIADRSVINLLLNALSNTDYVVRWAVVEALAWIKDVSVAPNLMYLLRDPSWTVRTAVIRAMLELGDNSVIPALIGSLDDEHPLVRETAAEALGRLHADLALPALVQRLRDPESFVRRAVAIAVGSIQESGESGIQSLIKLLEDPDPQVRWAAVESLGTLRDPSAVDALIDRLGDTYVPMWETRRICDVVAEALLAIGDESGIHAVELWRLGQLT